MLCKYGSTTTRNEAFSGEKTDISQCVPFYSHGWVYRSPEERLASRAGVIKPLKERAVQAYMLGYCTPFPINDISGSTPFLKNSYICYIPSSNSIIPRHDCSFNTNSTASALTNYEENTSNIADGITSPEEEFDYDLLMGKSVDPSSWEGSPIQVDSSNPLPNDEEIAPSDENVEESNSSEIIEDNNRKVPTNRKITGCSLTSTRDSSKRIRTNTPHYEEYAEQLRLKTSKKNSITDTVNLMKETFPDMSVEAIDPSPKMPIPAKLPSNLSEALKSTEAKYWYIAWQTEMQRLIKRNTWEETPVPFGRTKVKSKYAFRVTVRVDGTLKFRCRLVACGYTQVLGKDFDETFAPTAKYKSLCVVLHLAAIHGWFVDGIDVENAYLEAKIDKEIYMTLPLDAYRDSITNQPVTVRLLRSLYGLKQAGELWYQLLNKLILQQGFTRLIHDQCIYLLRGESPKDVLVVVVYVDDVLFIGNSKSKIEMSINTLAKSFTKLVGTTDITRYIGVDLLRDHEKNTIILSQKPYIEKYVSEHVPLEAPIKGIPMQPSLDYSVKGDGSHPPIQKEVGSIRYLGDRTRPDLLASLGMLGSAAADPSTAHIKGVHNLGQYLKGTTDYAITLGGSDPEVKLFGYTDASHLSDETSKPRLGFCFFLNLTSGVIYARSVKDSAVSHSSCESEIKAIDLAIRQAIWFRGLLKELGFPQIGPTVLYTDSISAKALADTARLGSNSCHLVLRINYIHECIMNGIIELKYITTENEVADVLTKILPLPLHERHTDFLLHGHNGKLPDVRQRVKVSVDNPISTRIFRNPKTGKPFRRDVSK